MVNVANHCWNLHSISFCIFIDHCQIIWVGKSLFFWHAMSWDCLLTHWLPMKCILFLMERIYQYQFKCNYPRNKKPFTNFLLQFWNLDEYLNVLTKKTALIDFVFPKLWTPETWSDKGLKSPISENPSRSNMVNVTKHCRNLYHTTFMIFIDPCQVNWVGKRLSYWHANSWDCLLTHWLLMKSILFLIGTIQRYQFICNYLRNKKSFVNFLLHFWNVHEYLNLLTKKMTLKYFVFPKLWTPETWSDKGLKSPISENPSTSNMVNVTKHCRNLYHTTFMIFIDHCEVN